MYSRDYNGRTLNFEPSGGLMKGSLVMQDKETDSYWSIMTGKAEAGAQSGTRLDELPVGVKLPWKKWHQRHPDTLVLSVNGTEDLGRNVYSDYFDSDQGFRQMTSPDKRLETKTPVFTFRENEEAVAVPFSEFEGGAIFDSGDRVLFLYRPQGARIFHSTTAYSTQGGDFTRIDGQWVHQPSGARFDVEKEAFLGPGEDLQKASGFDTFWYNWSLIHADSKILRKR